MTRIVALPVRFNAGNTERTLFPVIAGDSKTTVLIDTGFPGQLPLLEAAAEQEGFSFSSLAYVVITHHDIDHMGSLAALKKKYPFVQIVASAIEADYISGVKKSPRLEMAEERLAMLPASEQKATRDYIETLQRVERVPVDKLFKEGELMSCLGGILAISTPGHMRGHISLYFEAMKVLVAGDALGVRDGKLQMADPYYTLNMAQAKDSVQKFLKYDIRKIICYHGGLFEGDCRKALEGVLDSWHVNE
ncbi:MBL fold metallo-hydrolase [Microbacter margulisiae]|uniref:Glyoxylase-like metal-dependent hydrolase (Beta-lactamase superfamily II) n=1 Tax=Microbacter margulisiae TaxID=1350067 RepID=A0A7W5DNT6_9PORP|nr:MBL fold metallo-hydrolase [Microbacter margulisiae]MBB3186030.1 glyoxylase-like metal-dependent hydrolase (beta-lactamase superfamily II) [Microbacter margulisiae]